MSSNATTASKGLYEQIGWLCLIKNGKKSVTQMKNKKGPSFPSLAIYNNSKSLRREQVLVLWRVCCDYEKEEKVDTSPVDKLLNEREFYLLC